MTVSDFDFWDDATADTASQPLEADQKSLPLGRQLLDLNVSVGTILRQRKQGLDFGYKVALETDALTSSEEPLTEADKEALKNMLLEQVDEQIIQSCLRQMREKLEEESHLAPHEAQILLTTFRSALELILLDEPEISQLDQLGFIIATLVKATLTINEANAKV